MAGLWAARIPASVFRAALNPGTPKPGLKFETLLKSFARKFSIFNIYRQFQKSYFSSIFCR